MEVWQIVLYGAAALLALKSLAALMTAYRERLVREAAELEQEQRRQEQARIRAERAAARKKAQRPDAA
jgi:hypothetical protein